ncbi:hypothetical protein BAC7755_53110 [Bacillus sp. MN7755]
MDIEIHTTIVNIKILILYMKCFLVRMRFTIRKFLFKKNEQNFKSVFTFVQLRVRMKLLKDMRSDNNEYCKVN